MRLSPAVLAAAATLACSAPDQQADVTQAGRTGHDPAVVQQAIDSGLATFIAAMKAGDTVTSASVYAEDAWVLAPAAPVAKGRAAIMAQHASMLRAMKMTDATIRTTDLIVTGDYAIESGTYQMTLVPQGGKAMTDVGKYVAVWRRDADGKWRMIRDVFNSDGGA